MNFEEVRKIFKNKMKYHLTEGRNKENDDEVRKYHRISAISVSTFAYFSEIISPQEREMYDKLIERWTR